MSLRGVGENLTNRLARPAGEKVWGVGEISDEGSERVVGPEGIANDFLPRTGVSEAYARQELYE